LIDQRFFNKRLVKECIKSAPFIHMLTPIKNRLYTKNMINQIRSILKKQPPDQQRLLFILLKILISFWKVLY